VVSTTYIEGYDDEDLLQLSYIAMYLAVFNYDPQHIKDPVNFIKEAVLNTLYLEIEKRRSQGCFLCVDNLSGNDLKMIENNSYIQYLVDKNMDFKGKVNFMIEDKFYFNNVQEFFCVCSKVMDIFILWYNKTIIISES
jgi:hypothetical protein